MLCLNRR